MSDGEKKEPIVDFVKRYAQGECVRLHMPGHKGKSFLGVEKYDITEIDGADELFAPEGIIWESEKNLSRIFDSRRSFYSAEGSSLSIKTMLCCGLKFSDKSGRKKVVAGRNAHKAFLYSSALLDFDVVWIETDERNETDGNLYSCTADAFSLEKTLKHNPDASAVYVTSPDYTGKMCDISALSQVCRKYEVPLLVDNAHGAYLKFLPKSLHPISLGADMCCDSAHKTLPVLTGGGYLHVGKNALFPYENAVKPSMEMFASTSPSYLILSSLDRANTVLENDFPEKLNLMWKKISNIKEEISSLGYGVYGDEPLKITLKTKQYGYLGCETAKVLKENKIVPEAYDRDNVILMFSPYNEDGDREALLRTLKALPKKEKITEPTVKIPRLKSVMTPREALMCQSEIVPVENAVDRVLASPSVSCPPAIPVAICGDLLTKEAVDCFKYYGVSEVYAVKEK